MQNCQLFFIFLSLENNEKKKSEGDAKTVDKVNEQNKDNGQQRNTNDAPKNLLIDLSNESKAVGNSWVRNFNLQSQIRL